MRNYLIPLALALTTGASFAEDLPPEILNIEGDVEYGEYLASECLTCHRADGDTDGIPAITGWYPEDFVYAMHDYRRGLRQHPVVEMISKRLSNEEIAALAAYFEVLGE